VEQGQEAQPRDASANSRENQDCDAGPQGEVMYELLLLLLLLLFMYSAVFTILSC